MSTPTPPVCPACKGPVYAETVKTVATDTHTTYACRACGKRHTVTEPKPSA